MSARRRPIAFVCYAREDSEMRAEIAGALEAAGIDPRGDWLLQPGPAYQDQLRKSIEEADAVLYLISRDSLSSEPCRRELQTAETLKKRLVPVVVRADFDEAQLPSAVANAQWAFCRSRDELPVCAESVTAAVLTDWDLAAVHSALTSRAAEWESRGKSAGLLLRGVALREAEEWLPRVSANPLAFPNVTPLQAEFILASQRARTRTVSAILVIATIVAITLAGLTVYAFQRRNAEREARKEAEAATRLAQERQQAALARQLAVQAQVLEGEQPAKIQTSVLLALESMRRLPTVEADMLLRVRGELLPRAIARIPLAEFCSFAFSRDSSRFVTACRGRPIEVRDPRSQQILMTINAPAEVSPVAIAFGADSRTVWYLGSDGWVRRWADSATEEKRFNVSADGQSGYGRFSPDGAFLLTQGTDDAPAVWRTDSGKTIPLQEPPESSIGSFSADGRIVVMMDGGGMTVSMWSLPSGRKLRTVVEENGAFGAAVSPDGSYVLVLGMDGTLSVIDTAKMQVTMRLAAESITHIAMSPRGRMFAVVGQSGTLRVWTATGVEVFRRGSPDASLDGAFDAESVAFSPDERILATMTRRMIEHEDPQGMTFKGGKRYRTEFADTVWLWDVDLGPRTTLQHGGKALIAPFSADGSRVALADAMRDHIVRVLSLPDMREVAVLPGDMSVRAVSFAPDATRVATATFDQHAYEWHLDQSPPQRVPLAHDGRVWACSYSGDGKRIATAGEDKRVRIWTSGRAPAMVRSIQLNEETRAVALSTRGDLVAFGIDDGFSVVNVADGRVLKKAAIGGAAERIAFSDDDRWIVAVPRGREAVAADWRGTRTRRFQHDAAVGAAQFSRGAEVVAVGDRDGSIRLWRLSDGREVARMHTGGPISALSFSRDGKTLQASIDTAGFGAVLGASLRSFRWRPEDVISDICTAVTRNLTDDEWRRYLPEESYPKTCPNAPAPVVYEDD